MPVSKNRRKNQRKKTTIEKFLHAIDQRPESPVPMTVAQTAEIAQRLDCSIAEVDANLATIEDQGLFKFDSDHNLVKRYKPGETKARWKQRFHRWSMRGDPRSLILIVNDLMAYGPVTDHDLATYLDCDIAIIKREMAKLESEGEVIRKEGPEEGPEDEIFEFKPHYLPGETPEGFLERVREIVYREDEGAKAQQPLILSTVEILNSLIGEEGFVAISNEQLARRLIGVVAEDWGPDDLGPPDDIEQVGEVYSNRVAMMMYFRRYRGEDGNPIYARLNDPVNAVLAKDYEEIPIDFTY